MNSQLSASVPVIDRHGYKIMFLASDWSLNDACLREKAESLWSNLIHIIELSTSLKRHYWASNGRANWVRTLVPVRPWACSMSTSHSNSHLRVLIQLTAQIQPVRTVSWTLYKHNGYWCSAWNLRCCSLNSGRAEQLCWWWFKCSCSVSQRRLVWTDADYIRNGETLQKKAARWSKSL